MDIKIIAILVMCLLCVSIGIYFVFLKKPPAQDIIQSPVPIPQIPILMTDTPSPTPTATSAPPGTPGANVMLYAPGPPPYPGYPGYPAYPSYPGYPGYPPVNPYWRPPYPVLPRPIQPGGSFSELIGRDKDDAVAYILSTYPNMTVAVVRYGGTMPSDARTDRFVVVYDVYTRKVVGAQIG